jgi:hypothetical protein
LLKNKIGDLKKLRWEQVFKKAIFAIRFNIALVNINKCYILETKTIKNIHYAQSSRKLLKTVVLTNILLLVKKQHRSNIISYEGKDCAYNCKSKNK